MGGAMKIVYMHNKHVKTTCVVFTVKKYRPLILFCGSDERKINF
jgi:hypothetical protein